MKKTSGWILLLMVAACCGSSELADNLNSKFPVLLLGKVTEVSGAYFQASVDWRMKGVYNADVITLSTDESRPFLRVGDRVVIGMNRSLEKPLDETDLPG